MAVRVAINGFGRIGRLVLRSIIEHDRKDIEVVAINDLGPVETNAHLLQYDTVHGKLNEEVSVDGDMIRVDAQAGVLEKARAAGVPAAHLAHRTYADRPAFEAALQRVPKEPQPDLICLAVFMLGLNPRGRFESLID